MLRGAVGQCVQKVAEAEALAWGGIPDILVSNQVVGAGKLARLAALASSPRSRSASTMPARSARSPRRPRLPASASACWSRSIAAPAAAAWRRGRTAVALAERIAASPHLRFGGLQSYHGSAQHKRTPGRARGGDRPCRRGHPPHGGAAAPARPVLRHRRRRRHRHLRAGGGERRLYGNPGRLLRLHGCRLCPQRQPAAVPPVAVRAGDGDEPGAARHRRGGCRAQGGGDRQRPAAGPWPPRAALCRRVRRARQAAGRGRRRRRRSARSCAWCPAIATRRSTATTGMSGSAAAGWNASGRSPRAGRCTEAGRQRAVSGTAGYCLRSARLDWVVPTTSAAGEPRMAPEGCRPPTATTTRPGAPDRAGRRPAPCRVP